jgi:glycosyltransferase involved in cell wall biosynthesis
MKALIFDPYFDTLGGGERYCLTVAECLLENSWQTDLWWDQTSDLKKAIERFGLNIDKLGLIGKKMEEFSFIEKLILMRKYDLVFWLSDGSIPTLTGRNNILHIQAPLTGFSSFRVSNLIKKLLISKVVFNSKFTRNHLSCDFKGKSIVLYPPIDVNQFSPGKKENIIIGVGRFEQTTQMQTKRQDVLVRAFKKMVDKGLSGWKLVLVGGSLGNPQKNKNLIFLKKASKGYPIEFIVDGPFEVLKDYYSKAKIFWHAAGYDIDEQKEPWKVEHFGITPVEAMAAGCVPVVIDKGGLKEIVRRGVGYRWGTEEELVKITSQLIGKPFKIKKLSLSATKASKDFSKSRFNKQFLDILNEN